MTVIFEIEVARGAVILTSSGSPVAEDYWTEFEQACQHPDYRPAMSTLVDARAIDPSAVSSEEVQYSAERAEKGPQVRKYGRVAIVVSRDLDFGLARMYEIMCESSQRQTRVFRSIDEAWQWIDEAQPAPEGQT